MADFLREDERRLLESARKDYRIDMASVAIADILQRLAEARRVLASVEWSGRDNFDSYVCPVCINYKTTWRHQHNCALAAALEGVERP